MSLPIHVDAYAGHRGDERPRRFVVDEEAYEVDRVEDQWYSPDARFFKVLTRDGGRYLLRHDEHAGDWTLQSGFDGDNLLARPGVEVIAVDQAQVRAAERRLRFCESCHPAGAGRSFEWLLRELTGRTGRVAFFMPRRGRCPRCGRPITERTRVALLTDNPRVESDHRRA